MNKKLVTALCSTLAVATALPALADHTIGGYIRTTGYAENLVGLGQAKSSRPDMGVDQRFRARWQNNINEYVSATWFGEVDTPWGEQSKGAIGNGGKQGNDGVNVETKHAYLDFKIPNAPYALATRVGAQGMGDDGAFNSVVMDDDMLGIKFDAKTEMATITAAWTKLSEGTRNKEDDSDLYILKAALTPVAGLKLMPQLWIADNKTTDVMEYYLGVNAAYKIPMADLSGWLLYDGGEKEKTATTKKLNISAFAASAKATADVAGAKAGLRLMYFTEDKSKNDRKSFSPPNGNNGAYEFADENLGIFLADAFYMNTSGGRLALTDAAYAGYGLFGAVASGSFVPPTMKNMYVKGGLGYFTALTDKVNGGAKSRDGNTLGTELSVRVGYKMAEKVDLSLNAQYAFLGDFYNKTNVQGKDPDDLYRLNIMLNVPY